ncbi:THAP domain-containing protein 7, partial [Acipenser ruthenus]|uniref:THAP domain-containing protein 7 n=1 Tax=Acipenser ruthenus TaxID=7906 RepID=UPI002742000E
MPRHCSAAGCRSRDTRETRRGGTTFHRLPKRGNPRRTLWLLSCRRTDPQGRGMWDPQSQFIYFCSKHFSKDCFELVGTSGYHRLKDEALPTIFEPFSKLRRDARCKRAGKRRGEEREIPAWVPQRGSRQRKSSETSGVPKTEDEEEEEEEEGEGAGPEAGWTSKTDQPIGTEQQPGEERDLPPIPGAVSCEGRGLSEAAGGWGVGGATAGAGLERNISGGVGGATARAGLEQIQLERDEEAEEREREREGEELARATSPRPASPSVYMARLPPPPGSYIAREHSYGVQSPLCWRARAEAAREGMERAHRQLAAARRRELRLRHRLAVLLQERRSGGNGEGE